MRFDLTFERVYSHPVETVWQALVNPAALGQWLMETDFVPEIGRDFQMWCHNPDGETDRYLCRVLMVEPPSRLAWSWILEGRQDGAEDVVEFTLQAVAAGTRLTIHHHGDLDQAAIGAFKSGWPKKLDLLSQRLER